MLKIQRSVSVVSKSKKMMGAAAMLGLAAVLAAGCGGGDKKAPFIQCCEKRTDLLGGTV